MLVRMSEEPDDYEGPWPEGDSMTEWVMVPRDPTEAMFSASRSQEWDTFDQEWRAMLAAAPAAPQQAEPVSEFQRSAPERIWLNVGDINDEDRFEDVSNDGCEWICWCEDSQDKNDVPYVRADLAHPPADEVQGLRTAVLALLNELDSGRHGAHEFNNLRNALRALEGG